MIQYDTETKTNRKWKLLYTTEYSFHLRNERYENKMAQPYQEEFEDTKGAIRIRISKKNRQHNGKKKYKRTNNDQQDIHLKLKIDNISQFQIYIFIGAAISNLSGSQIPECDIFSRVWSSTITPSTKGSMFFIILNASSKEDFEFLLESVKQWDTLCTYHYLNKATTTIISPSNIFINNNRKKMSTMNI